MFKSVWKFVTDQLQDDGKWSLSRVTSACTVVITHFWVTFLVIKTKTLPDLTGPALFIGAGGVAPHAVGKWQAMIQQKLGLNNGQDSDQNKTT